jgi:Uma2 family endonuclease
VSTIAKRISRDQPLAVPPLANGDRLTQPEFHRRYEACPKDMKFELIGGTVYMASPLRVAHASYEEEVSFALGLYRRATLGVQLLANATTILGENSEPQPDLALRIMAECGGQSHVNADGYVEGPPELLVEVAYSTRAIDLHQKRDDYHQAGVREYLVLCVEEQELYWFGLQAQRSIRADAEGIYRSRVFPGLWLDGPALLAGASARVAEVVQRGLGQPAHAAFVKRLQTARRKRS